MTVTLFSSREDSISLQEMVEHCDAHPELRDPEEALAHAHWLKALCNNKHFLTDHLNEELKDVYAFQRKNDFRPPTFILHRGAHYTVRAVVWLPPDERMGASLFSYHEPHDHNFDCAGMFDWASVQDARLGTWDSVLDLNLRSAIHLTRHAIVHLGRSESSAIVNIASVAGKDHLAKGAIYSATKFGMFGFAGCLFEDVRDMGIKVCTIAPGQVASRIDHAPVKPSAYVPPQDIARVVSFVLEFPGTSCPTEIVLRAQRSPGG